MLIWVGKGVGGGIASSELFQKYFLLQVVILLRSFSLLVLTFIFIAIKQLKVSQFLWTLFPERCLLYSWQCHGKKVQTFTVWIVREESGLVYFVGMYLQVAGNVDGILLMHCILCVCKCTCNFNWPALYLVVFQSLIFFILTNLDSYFCFVF